MIPLHAFRVGHWASGEKEGKRLVYKKKAAVLLCLLLVGSMMATTAAVSAKKPDNPGGGGGGDDGPTPTGTIYYGYPEDGVGYMWTMDPDGTSRTKVGGLVGGSMSAEKHGGHYWYVRYQATSGKYPDGQWCQEIFAARDDGGTPVQLTDDVSLATNYICCPPAWGPGDAFISWSACRWGTDAGGDYVHEAGIYAASVTFDGNGDVTGIGGVTLVHDTGYWSASVGGGSNYYPVARDSLDWSPDGGSVVYGTNGGTYLYDTETDSSSKLTNGYYANWNPDGTLIALLDNNDLLTIKPDGTGRTTVVDLSNTKSTNVSVQRVLWSPDGEFMSYLVWKRSLVKFSTSSYIYVVQKDGTDDNCISKGGDRMWVTRSHGPMG